WSRPRPPRRPPGSASPLAGVVDPAHGPRTGRVTGYRTVVNRVGANYGVVLHLGTLGGAKALRDRVPRTGAARRGLPAGASR
ncbi:hypothetical protein, partial [Streptomyces mirabilis]|uniref:hypothetical protein n=1 Tax=Streptomyces mirabilis TaxID=68239 RepID=UPI00368E5A03